MHPSLLQQAAHYVTLSLLSSRLQSLLCSLPFELWINGELQLCTSYQSSSFPENLERGSQIYYLMHLLLHPITISQDFSGWLQQYLFVAFGLLIATFLDPHNKLHTLPSWRCYVKWKMQSIYYVKTHLFALASKR